MKQIRSTLMLALSLVAISCGGDDGAPGSAGDAGASAVVSVSNEAPNCANGGFTVSVGVDLDGDGILDESEVESTQEVCNGEQGPEGGTGSDGFNSLTRLDPVLPGCARVSAGIDNGDGADSVSGNGVLEDGEVDSSVLIGTCTGSFELSDPTPGDDDRFGSIVAILSNGNIAVADPRDDAVLENAGAVHLYDGVTLGLIASLRGDDANDGFGNRGVTALSNGNFVISTSQDDEGGQTDVGSVHLVDGQTGAIIGTPLFGNDADDRLGSGGIVELSNGNFVVSSPNDDEGGQTDVGSVRLVDGQTGMVIGVPLVGDVSEDEVGSRSPVALPNGNYVVRSPNDDEGGIVDAGAVRLVDGQTGALIGTPLVGDVENDRIGSSRVSPLPNGNYVVRSSLNDENGVINAGSAHLMDGQTGVVIGTPLIGDVENDFLGGSVTTLSNGNFVVSARFADENGLVDSGLTTLVNGATGAVIGEPLAGDDANDNLGEVVALSNGNYVVSSSSDDDSGSADVGSVRLMNGATGAPIGATLFGGAASESLGNEGVTPLPNGNFVVLSSLEDVGGNVDVGSVRLIDGATGAPIGAPFPGGATADFFNPEVVALANNNFALVAPSADDPSRSLVDAGRVQLLSGVDASPVGPALFGAVADDFFAVQISALPNNNYVLLAPFADPTGVNTGLLQLFDGTTGMARGEAFTGVDPGDLLLSSGVIVPAHGDFFILQAIGWRQGSLDSAGLVRLFFSN